MTKIAARFLALTFAIVVVCWGLCVVCGLCGVTFETMPLLRIPYLLGGWSPTIASYAVLRRSGRVGSLREWLGTVFAFRQSWQGYALVALFGVLYILPQCLMGERGEGAPLFLLPVLVAMMLPMGGLEEAGWRYVLQPELEKKLPFVPVVLLMALVWWLWHLPLFFIPETGQAGTDYGLFGLMVLGLSFALEAIYRRTGSVWLCVLFHCLDNALTAVFPTRYSLTAALITAALLTVAGLAVAYWPKKNQLT